MTELEAVTAILTRFEDQWTTLQPGVSYFFGNEVGEATSSWARVTVRHTVRDQVTHGIKPHRKFETRGVIFVQLFAPLNAGVGALADLCDDARVVFEGESIAVGAESVNLYGGTTNNLDDDGTWNMATVTIPFRYTETR